MTDQPKQPQTSSSVGSSQSEERDDIFSAHWFHILATALMCLLTVACCAVPILLSLEALGVISSGDGGPSQMELLTSVVTMFGILMAGIFVFMTIRIDRGAKEEARRAAKDAVAELENVVLKVQNEVRQWKRERRILARSLDGSMSRRVAKLDEKTATSVSRLEGTIDDIKKDMDDVRSLFGELKAKAVVRFSKTTEEEQAWNRRMITLLDELKLD